MTYCDTYLIKQDEHLLCISLPETLALPSHDYSERHFWQSCAFVNEQAEKHLGAKVFVKRCYALQSHAETLDHYYELELLNQPTVAVHWCSSENLDALGLPPEKYNIVLAFMQENGQLQRPWAQSGFYTKAIAWLNTKLSLPTHQLEGLTQLRSWERSCVLRVPTDKGNVYFKAQPKMFAHETPLLRFLNELAPGRVPALLAENAKEGWQLLAELPGEALSLEASRGTWMEVYQQYGQLQGALIRFEARLLGLGVPDRRLPVLYARLDSLFSELERYPGLSSQHIAGLRARLPEFKLLCQQLEAFPLPASLDHGDLWWGNVFVHQQQATFFDWSDCVITHPFFTLAMLWQEDLSSRFDASDLKAIQTAYFVTFRSFGSTAVLERAMEIAKVLAPLHYASYYHDHIMPQLETPWELERMVAYFLRKLV